MICAVAFDMDGLMFDTERLIQESWQNTGLEMGYQNIGDMIYTTLGCSETDTEQIYYQQLGQDFPYHEFRAREKAVRHKYIEEHGLPIKQGLIELLEYLKEQGYPMVVATSTRTVTATAYLKQAGVFDYFIGVVGGDQVAHSKPNPEIYGKACAMLGYPPCACMALEDSYNGIRAAFAAGMQAVMIPDIVAANEEMDQKTVAQFSSLAMVIDWLQTK